ncbi:carboxypeptidase-like regulatory domain-containing protein [Pseudogulbenkiania sp. MAI-1]|uniref:carboxypeptidase-like regulatory domain-containing protein n=1 Tax=Pseudogulbenkiania sp. MAI-1 TaxID=990370 RepID=UPI0004B4CE6E|nr:carboxypeptidase-like regulatory domain-containing protein [Pseudogulbenkiania sp. MAI-1]
MTAAAEEALPQGQTQGQASFISGGIGADEVAAMKAVRQDYNLRLLFAAKGSGEYLADVAVVVRNARGDTVLDTVAKGPFFYARLPAGQYQVSASYQDKSQARKVRLGRSGSELSFYW